MKRITHSTILYAIAIGALASACSTYKGQKPTNDASYTTHTNASTTVTVYPPEPVLVSTTRTTSSRLGVDKQGLETPDKQPMLTDSPQSAKVPGHPDSRMSERIHKALNADDTLRDVDIHRLRVVTVDGQVTLSGAVPTLADKVAIEQRVREVKGVEAVDNELEVLR